MKNILNFVGRLASFDFVGNYFFKKWLDKGAAALAGILFKVAAAGHLPPLPGGEDAWTTFLAAVLAGLVGALQNKAKHYGKK